VTTETVYVGIDPGKHGAVAVRYPGGVVRSIKTPVIVHVYTYPKKKDKKGRPKKKKTVSFDLRRMFSLLSCIKRDAYTKSRSVVIGIELQSARERDSKSNVFKTGLGYGYWLAILKLLFEPAAVREISPTSWKPCYVHVEGSENMTPEAKYAKSKKESLAVARKLYPKHKLPLVADEARAEALLMADYMYRKDLAINHPITKEMRSERRQSKSGAGARPGSRRRKPARKGALSATRRRDETKLHNAARRRKANRSG